MLALVIKADADTSARAMADSLDEALSGRARVIHQGVGAIGEADVRLAADSAAMLVGFHARPTAAATTDAESAGVEIRFYDTLVEAVDDLRAHVDGAPAPDRPYAVRGTAEVRRMLPKGLEKVAVCVVTEGSLRRRGVLRVFRDGVQVYEGRPGRLRRLGSEVEAVDAGHECELTFEYYDELQPGDVLECVSRRS
ncbi:MAG TPA: hypothetical protein VF705_14360 [Longimicrobium sp.]|jgi:translation initiation factor IF-2